MKVVIALFALMLGLFLAGCMGESSTYGEEEVAAAFEQAGIPLTENSLPENSGEFISKSGGFFVYVLDPSEADDLWSAAELNPFARRANVVVFAVDPYLTAQKQRRVLNALEALPESGTDVEVAVAGG